LLDAKLKRFRALTEDTKLTRIRELMHQRDALDAELTALLEVQKKERKPRKK
jgi:hypothetical protein